MSLSYWNRTYAQWVYQYLLGQLNNNAIGVSALMGKFASQLILHDVGRNYRF